VVDFQTARQQIEQSLISKQLNVLQNADKQDLIKELLERGITADEIQEYIDND